jgi:DNA-binding MarR family transcriptional regulator
MQENIKRSILTHLYQINRRTRQQGAGGMGVENLTMHQMQALFFIKNEQPVRMRELADELLISPGSATLLADRLVESGWLVRTPDENDRRSIRLELSAEAGRKLIELLKMKMRQTGVMLDKLELKDMRELDRILALLQDPR